MEIGRTFTGHQKVGNELIKTLLLKIVHNKNHKVLRSLARVDSNAEKSAGLAFKRPFIH
jgi:hypothetical protein